MNLEMYCIMNPKKYLLGEVKDEGDVEKHMRSHVREFGINHAFCVFISNPKSIAAILECSPDDDDIALQKEFIRRNIQPISFQRALTYFIGGPDSIFIKTQVSLRFMSQCVYPPFRHKLIQWLVDGMKDSDIFSNGQIDHILTFQKAT